MSDATQQPSKERYSTKPDLARSSLTAEIDECGDIRIMVSHRDGREAWRYLSPDETAELRDWLSRTLPASSSEPPAVTWPQSKGDPIGPVWSYGGKKRMHQAEALRMMAHDLVERIKWLEAEPRAVLKQAQDIDGVDTFALIKALHKTIDGQRKHIAALEKARAAQLPAIQPDADLSQYRCQPDKGVYCPHMDRALAAASSQPPGLKLPDDPRELLVTTARDAGFSDHQWKAMFYESGPYDVTFPCFTTKKFIALLLERLQATPTKGDGQ